MARKALLYRSLNINNSEFIHTRYTTPAAFEAGISSYKIGEVDMNNYRETPAGIFRFNLADYIPAQSVLSNSFEHISYLIVKETEDREGVEAVIYWRCYFVQSVVVVSGCLVLNCAVDYWGSYWHLCDFVNFRVAKCNRAIGEGVYDDVDATYGEPRYFFLAQNGVNRPISEYCAVVSIAVELQGTYFGNNSLTQTFLFKIPLADIAAAVKSTYADVDILEKVRFIVGGITQCGGVSSQNLKAQALRCWILPIAAIPDGDLSLPIVCSSLLLNNNGHTFDCNVVKAGSYTEDYDFHEANLGAFDNFYPNGNIAFGTLGTQMPLTRLTDSGKIQVWYMRESAGVKVIAYQGSNSQDISRSFELDVNINNQVGTSSQQFAENSAKIIALLAATAATYKSKGAGFAAAVGASGLLGLFGNGGGGSPAQMNGDAATTYAIPSASEAADYVRFPFWIMLTNSTDDEKAKARVTGANFDVFLSSPYDLFSYSLLGDKAGFTATYCKASCEISKIPLEAAAYIKDELARGIYFE